LIIRQEKIKDYDDVYHVVKEAFESAEHSDGNEQDLVVKLRKSESFIPELSLVAVEDDKIVGHILFTKAFVQDVEVLALAPLSVLPDYQNRGIGMSLMKEGHDIACKLGYQYSIVLGYSQYYSKVGYMPASQYGIKAPFEVDDESFMAICFSESQNKLNGIIEYDKAFGV
jgi:predicted N-acetyltransferase YhbS